MSERTVYGIQSAACFFANCLLNTAHCKLNTANYFFTQPSFNVTVRLNTNLSVVEFLSSVK